ncbi:MAG: type II toxin-antitoxin system antitoxin SocA domain-containing protein [Pseudomonadota bacterium]
MSQITQKQLGNIIKGLREDFDISQEALAKHLELTRQAVSQIEKGERKVDSLELLKIADFFSVNVDYMLNFTKEKIDSKKKANVKFNKEKLKNVLLYILKKCGGKPNVGETVIYKLLYFIDFNSYEQTGQPITGLPYLKMQFGPVPKIKEYKSVINAMLDDGELEFVSHVYHGKAQKRYLALVEPDEDLFSESEKKIMNCVIKNLSDNNATQIEELVHGDMPWKATPDCEIIDYGLVFQREAPYTTKDYQSLWESASANDILEDLGSMSEEEVKYYKELE